MGNALRRLRTTPIVRKAPILRAAATIVLSCTWVLLGGCATWAPPRAWEKGELAEPSMRFDADPLHDRALQHIYQSKEGAAGGNGVGGGGCGCN